MAYNAFYPYSYQPFGYQQNPSYLAGNGPIQAEFQQGVPNAPRTNNNGGNALIWVQGEAGAKAYPVGPGNTVDLWDSEAQIIYLKSADASGMPSMKILDYTIREVGKTNPVLQKQIDTSNFVTKDELERRLAEFAGGTKNE